MQKNDGKWLKVGGVLITCDKRDSDVSRALTNTVAALPYASLVYF